MESEIFLKLSEIKDIILKKIKSFEEYNNNKDIIINSIEEIEKILKEIFNKENKEINEDKEINENNLKKEINEKKEYEDNNIKEINNNNNISEDKDKEKELSNKDINKKDILNKNEIIEIKDVEKDNKEGNNINININSKDILFHNNEINENINKSNNNNNLQEDEETEKYLLPKLNFDYDKNINEILNDINLEQNKPFLRTSLENDKSSDLNYNNSIINKEDSLKNKNNSINNDIIRNISKKKDENKIQEQPINHLIKNKNEQIIPYTMKEINDENNNKINYYPNNNIKISNLQRNGYSDLFSFNYDLSNINNKSSFTTDEYSIKKNNILNINKNSNINNKIKNNNINTNNTFQSEENISKNINNKQNIDSGRNIPEYETESNIKNSKALRVADIIMKINSNDILYDIITQLYTKDILNQLMSPNVDINLINLIEQTIEKITILENEEIEKLRNKEPSEINNNNNERISDIYDFNPDSNLNINNLSNINNKINNQKNDEELKKQRTSFSFYDKNNSSCYSQLPPKVPLRRQINKYKAEYLNSEILQNYPKTGKTILGYEKFKKDRNKEFNFERSLRNDNYMNDYRKKRSNNFNNSKADSIGKNQSYNSNNRSFSNKKIIFNNYTSPFGDYFDGSLQKGGQSKLKMNYPKSSNNILFKNCRSPVKDYIDGINDLYI